MATVVNVPPDEHAHAGGSSSGPGHAHSHAHSHGALRSRGGAPDPSTSSAYEDAHHRAHPSTGYAGSGGMRAAALGFSGASPRWRKEAHPSLTQTAPAHNQTASCPCCRSCWACTASARAAGASRWTAGSTLSLWASLAWRACLRVLQAWPPASGACPPRAYIYAGTAQALVCDHCTLARVALT